MIGKDEIERPKYDVSIINLLKNNNYQRITETDYKKNNKK